MDKKAVQEIIKQRTNKIIKLGNTLSKENSLENIHKFRVEIKRFRSFLRLIASSKKNAAKKIPAGLKKIYDTCGLIREAQLEQEKIARAALKIPSYSAHLTLLIKKQEKKWESNYNKELIDTFKEKTANYQLHTPDAGILPRFFIAHAVNIQNLCKKATSDEDIHSIRKQVKDMLYNAKFAEEEWKEAYNKIKKLPLKTLDELSDMLGAYNDRRIMLDHFSSFTAATMHKSEKEILNNYCVKEGKALQAQKKKILATAKRLSKTISLLPMTSILNH